MSQVDSDFEAGFEEVGFENSAELIPAEGAGVDSPAITQAPAYRKQGFSIYTVMLILSFVMLIAAMILLFMEAGRFSN